MNVRLFVCLFNSYTVPFSREDMRRVIYSDFSCHLYTIKKQENDDRLYFKSSKTISLINSCLKSRKRLFHSKLSFVIVSHSSWCFVSDLHSLCRVRIICADFKTIKSFVKWSQNDQVFSDRTFWILFHVWSFYFVLNSCTRKRHSAVIEDIIKDVLMIDENDQRMMWLSDLRFQSESAFIFFDFNTCFLRILSDHHFLLVSLKLLCDMLVNCLLWRSSCILENALSLIINRSSSMSLSKNRRRRRLLELRWDVWTVTARLLQEDIWILWRSVRRCLKTSLNSFHAYLLTFSFEARRILSTSAVYDASSVFELHTSISRIQLLRFCEDNFSIRFCLFESERWSRFRIASFSWIFWEHSWWASWWFDEWFFQWWWFFKSQLIQSLHECEFQF
jgi:hypothetical protein